MKSAKYLLSSLLAVSMFCLLLNAQQTSSSAQSVVVPRLVNFSGNATGSQRKIITGIAGATFAIYKDQYEGAPLWLETQNVQADAKGNYTVQLGATKPDGLPLDVFTSGEARWLGVTINGGQEQPRVLLLSVPYALKAADAETIGGLPPSAFVLAAPVSSAVGTSASGHAPASSSSAPPPASSNVTTTGGTVNALPLWTTATNIQSSAITQSGSGSSAKVGINTTTPGSTLDVNGAETVRGNLSLPAAGTATATAGKNSQPTTLTASVFNKTTGTAVSQNFRWQAEPVGNDTTTASGSLNLLYGSGSNTLGETGLHIASNGQIIFAPGQSFAGLSGVVSSVGLSAPSSDFTITGSPVTKSGTLALNWIVAPTKASTANAIVKRDGSGSFSGGAITGTLGLTGLSASTAAVTGTNSGSGYGVYGTSATGLAILGQSSGTSGASIGVEGVTNSASSYAVAGSNGSSGIGVYGTSVSGTGVYGDANSTTAAGVFGINTASRGTGVFGVSGNESSTGAKFSGYGVHGDAGSSQFAGVLGTADAGAGGIFFNNSPNSDCTLIVQAFDSSSPPFTAFNIPNNAGCDIDAGGNLSCTGTYSAVVPLNGGKRRVATSAIQSPENWFEDFGSAQLVNGMAVVQLDPDFTQTVNSEKNYRVFPVPNGDCKGLYVTNKTGNSFEVRELGGGTSSVSFDYRITAIRKNYETVRFADHTNDPDPGKMLGQMRNAKPASSAAPSLKSPTQAKVRFPVAELTSK